MTETAASTDVLLMGAREEADVDHDRSNAEMVAEFRLHTRPLEADERIEADITPPNDPFGI